MKVLWMPLALGQIQEIAEHITRDKPQAARRWADRVFDLAAGLAAFPKQGRVVPESGREEIRELFHGHYRIIYRLDEETISVLTVRDGRRLFDGDDVRD